LDSRADTSEAHLVRAGHGTIRLPGGKGSRWDAYSASPERSCSRLAQRVARQARREHEEIPGGGQALVMGVSLALTGVLAVTLPYWFVPLFTSV